MALIVIDHYPPTVEEEAALVRRGVVKHPLTSEQRAVEEARAADRDRRRRGEAARDREAALRQADALLRAARR